jgi:hypothetical protein
VNLRLPRLFSTLGWSSLSQRTCTPGESERRIGHESAPNCSESCDRGGRRHRRSRCGFFAGKPGNAGTAAGLHPRRFPALRRTDTGCQPDRRVPSAKYRTAERIVPGRIRIECQRAGAGRASPALRSAGAQRSAETRLRRPIEPPGTTTDPGRYRPIGRRSVRPFATV